MTHPTRCTQSALTVEKYLLDELSTSEKRIFEDHMATCEQCRASVKAGRTVIAGIKAGKCQNDPNEVEYLLVNGEEEQKICSVCLKDEIFNFVTSNSEITFRYEASPAIQREKGVKAVISLV